LTREFGLGSSSSRFDLTFNEDLNYHDPLSMREKENLKSGFKADKKLIDAKPLIQSKHLNNIA
jgi:hypothetical protein